jgi:DNA-binding IclR family transcriptional regulator
VDRQPKERPSYAISSVDHALRLATMIQLEGELSVSEAAERLGVARSTAHRLLAMLVYRDFAVQTDQRSYRAGPVLELAAHSQSTTSRLRATALPRMEALVADVDESANLIIRTGDTARFVASVECSQALRVGNREGMAFPAHRVTGGLVLLAELDREQIESLYAVERYGDRPDQRPDVERLHRELRKIRSSGFAVNRGLSERGVAAIGMPLRDEEGVAVAGLSVSVPSVRFENRSIAAWVGALTITARAIQADLAVEA